MSNLPIESHPLKPFLPEGAKLLMLGSFPPQQQRWSMEFFYPNFQNDMWRIMGLIFFGEKHHFELPDSKHFDKERIVEFCTDKGIALYDTAQQVRRLKDNASDKFLEVVTPTDIDSLLESLPHCQAIVTTGQKASDIITSHYSCQPPKVGQAVTISTPLGDLSFWRMPSSSRAYPLSLPLKAEAYKKMFQALGIYSQQ